VLTHHVSTLSYDVYVAAGRRWLAGEPLYETSNTEGFQYLPHAALLLSPFALLGEPLGAIAWRALWWALYAAGILRLSRALAPAHARESLVLASCLAVASAAGTIGNGQANLAVAALMLHIAADVSEQRFDRATVALVLGFGLKPLLVVPMLLLWPLYRPLWLRVPLALVVLAALPFAFQSPSYVWAQHLAFVDKLRVAMTPVTLYEDLRGLLLTVHVALPRAVYWALRVVAALVVLAASVRVRNRMRALHAAVLIMALSAAFLVLFNPRSQSTSYDIPAGISTVLGVEWIEDGSARGLVFIALVLGWMLNYHTAPFIEHWLKPALDIAFGVVLGRQVLVAPAAWRQMGRPDRPQS